MTQRPRRALWWWPLVTGVALIYAIAAGWAWLASDGLLFRPEYGSREEPAGAFRLRTPEGEEFSAVHLPRPDARFTLWYFHGNAEALADIMPRLKEFHARGFAVFAAEYPGYGTSTGRPTERTVNASQGAALIFLREQLHVRSDSLILYGRSLGGGPAVELATRENVAGLVLESAFVSAYRVTTGWPLLPGDKFRNLAEMPALPCPVLVIHGRDDRVVPFAHGEKLLAAVRSPKRFLWVDGAGHNDVRRWAGETYWETLAGVTGSL